MKQIVLLLLLCASTGITLGFKLEYGNHVVVPEPLHDNLYAAGGSISVEAPVYGDVTVTGGSVLINDTVTNDILIAGGNVTIDGYVGGDVRCAGGNVYIRSNVAGDVLLAGGSVNIKKGITIGGLLAAGGSTVLDGNVRGDVKGAFGSLEINGFIAHRVDCRGGRITINGIINGPSILAAREIVVGDRAQFNEAVHYWTKTKIPDFRHAMRNGNASFDPSLKLSSGKWYYLGAETGLVLLWYLGMALAMILLIQYLFSGTMKGAADVVYNRSMHSMGTGFLFFLVFPATAIFAIITTIGIPIGLTMIFIYLILLLSATAISSVVIANWYNNLYEKSWNYWWIAIAAFGIFILLKLVSLMPFVGWLVMAVVAAISFGGILLYMKWRHDQKKLSASAVD